MTRFSTDDAARVTFVAEAALVGSPERLLAVVLTTENDVDTRSLVEIDLQSKRTGAKFPELVRPRLLKPDPNRSRVAFIADVDGVGQLHILDVEDQTLTVVTSHPTGFVGEPDWSPDGGRVASSVLANPARDRSLPFMVTRDTFRFDGIGYIDDFVQNICVVEVATGDVEVVTAGPTIDTAPRWAPDGRRLLYRSTFEPEERYQWREAINIVETDRGVIEQFGPASFRVVDADWLPDDGDGDVIVVVGALPAREDTLSLTEHVWTVRRGGVPKRRTATLVAGVGERLEFDWPARPMEGRIVGSDQSSIVITAQMGGSAGICRVGVTVDEVEFLVAGDGRACLALDWNVQTGTLAFVSTSVTEAPEIHVVRKGEETVVTDFNGWIPKTRDVPRVEHFFTEPEPGVALESWALLPPDGEAPFPSVLYIHGGPPFAFGNVFYMDFWLLASAGVAVIFANFRGSAGYGDDFYKALTGDWGRSGEPDHHAVIDRAIELRLADPDRIGVAGLSHGGFATCWLLGHSRRFRAGLAENPFVNWLSMYGTMDSPSYWYTNDLGGEAYELAEVAWDRSPLASAKDAQDPLMFVVGEEDYRCRVTEAEQFYRVLKATGATTQMLRLPGGDHLASWTGAPVLRAAQNQALVSWFSRHLLA